MTHLKSEEIDSVFVYGSLKRGEALYFLEPLMHLRLGVQPARVRGAVLYDLGPYPGMVLRPDGGPVLGEVHRFRRMRTVLEILDQVEDYYGEEDPDNLYRRVCTTAELLDGTGAVPCWLYEYVGPMHIARFLESGIWHGAETLP